MEIKYLSASAIRDFLQCELRLVFRSDRGKDSIKGDHAKLGTAVHEALEQFTKRMLHKKSLPDQSDYEFAIATYMNKATSEGLEDLTFYKEGKQIVVSYIDQYNPSEKIVEDGVEHFFRLTTPEGVPIVGAMDKVVQLDDNTIQIVDYKTARNAMTNFELISDIQLSMYDLAASLIWPQFTNRVLSLNYVRIGKTVSSHRTDEDRQNFREFLVSVWTQINKMNEKEVLGKLNKLCGWCDYKDRCSQYQSFLSSREGNFQLLTEMTDDEFLTHWIDIADKKSIIESRQRELKMLASHRFMQGKEVASNGRYLHSVQSSRTNYDIEDIVNIIPHEEVLSVLTVNKTRLDKYLRDRPEFKPEVDKVAKVSYTAPMYTVRQSTVVPGDDEIEDADQDADAA